MKRAILILAVAFIAGCATPRINRIDTSSIPVKGGSSPSTTGSIWPGETSRNALFQDLRAKNVGDIVTIRVSEKTSAIKEATTSTARSSTNDIAISKFLGLPLNFGMKDFLNQGQPFSPEIESSYDADFDGSGTTKRSGELSAVISTRITDVLANGNLVLEGRKDTIVNNEQQYIILSGIARPEDINEENVISSALLSDARIEYSGRGVIADEQSPGWMRRILDNVWPF
ncbi:MAG TPA: flagellar basal body L-ring protein FlgH [Thermodesulfobacteriota bacterium]